MSDDATPQLTGDTLRVVFRALWIARSHHRECLGYLDKLPASDDNVRLREHHAAGLAETEALYARLVAHEATSPPAAA